MALGTDIVQNDAGNSGVPAPINETVSQRCDGLADMGAIDDQEHRQSKRRRKIGSRAAAQRRSPVEKAHGTFHQKKLAPLAPSQRSQALHRHRPGIKAHASAGRSRPHESADQ